MRRISHILQIPLSTVFSWIKRAGQIVEKIIASKQIEEKRIEILEMDELFTFIKKNLERSRQQGSSATPMPEFGLLWIGTDLKLLRLK